MVVDKEGDGENIGELCAHNALVKHGFIINFLVFIN